MRQKPRFVGTTILAVRRDENVVLAGDGQVTLEQTQVKGRARKVRRLADGKVRYRETVTEGIESAPQAFLNLFTGDKVGKQIVKLG